MKTSNMDDFFGFGETDTSTNKPMSTKSFMDFGDDEGDDDIWKECTTSKSLKDRIMVDRAQQISNGMAAPSSTTSKKEKEEEASKKGSSRKETSSIDKTPSSSAAAATVSSSKSSKKSVKASQRMIEEVNSILFVDNDNKNNKQKQQHDQSQKKADKTTISSSSSSSSKRGLYQKQLSCRIELDRSKHKIDNSGASVVSGQSIPSSQLQANLKDTSPAPSPTSVTSSSTAASARRNLLKKQSSCSIIVGRNESANNKINNDTKNNKPLSRQALRMEQARQPSTASATSTTTTTSAIDEQNMGSLVTTKTNNNHDQSRRTTHTIVDTPQRTLSKRNLSKANSKRELLDKTRTEHPLMSRRRSLEHQMSQSRIETQLSARNLNSSSPDFGTNNDALSKSDHDSEIDNGTLPLQRSRSRRNFRRHDVDSVNVRADHSPKRSSNQRSHSVRKLLQHSRSASSSSLLPEDEEVTEENQNDSVSSLPLEDLLLSPSSSNTPTPQSRQRRSNRRNDPLGTRSDHVPSSVAAARRRRVAMERNSATNKRIDNDGGEAIAPTDSIAEKQEGTNNFPFQQSRQRRPNHHRRHDDSASSFVLASSEHVAVRQTSLAGSNTLLNVSQSSLDSNNSAPTTNNNNAMRQRRSRRHDPLATRSDHVSTSRRPRPATEHKKRSNSDAKRPDETFNGTFLANLDEEKVASLSPTKETTTTKSKNDKFESDTGLAHKSSCTESKAQDLKDELRNMEQASRRHTKSRKRHDALSARSDHISTSSRPRSNFPKVESLNNVAKKALIFSSSSQRSNPSGNHNAILQRANSSHGSLDYHFEEQEKQQKQVHSTSSVVEKTNLSNGEDMSISLNTTQTEGRYHRGSRSRRSNSIGGVSAAAASPSPSPSDGGMKVKHSGGSRRSSTRTPPPPSIPRRHGSLSSSIHRAETNASILNFTEGQAWDSSSLTSGKNTAKQNKNMRNDTRSQTSTIISMEAPSSGNEGGTGSKQTVDDDTQSKGIININKNKKVSSVSSSTPLRNSNIMDDEINNTDVNTNASGSTDRSRREQRALARREARSKSRDTKAQSSRRKSNKSRSRSIPRDSRSTSDDSKKDGSTRKYKKALPGVTATGVGSEK